MRRHLLSTALLVALSMVPAGGHAQTAAAGKPVIDTDVAGAKSFVEKIYADYANPDWAQRPRRQATFYTTDLYHAVQLDQRFHLEETPRLDGDPLCAYQDPGDPGQLAVQSVVVTPTSLVSASAKVKFSVKGAAHEVTLSLVKTTDGWRVSDVATKEVPSLYRASHAAAKKP
jgi:hypothetical protein